MDYKIATDFAETIKKNFVCTNYINKIIYKFDGSGWNRCDGNLELSRALNNYLDNNHKDKSLRIIERLTICNYIYTLICNDKYFLQKENSFLRLKNQVYDLNQCKLVLPSPFQKCIFKMDYDPENNDQNNEMLDKFIESIFPNSDIRKYFIRFMSSCLEPYNKDKILSVWLGNGNNGKSALIKLIEYTFADYYCKLPSNILTRKRGAIGQATPEIALLDQKHVAVVQEPDINECINHGVIKELTGNDSLYVRKLYSEAEKIEMTAKLILVANKLPFIDVTDKAACNRIVIIPFQTTFIHNLEVNTKYERKMDVKIDNKLKQMASSFLKLLIDEYPNYKLHGLETPQSIVTITAQSIKTFDTVFQFKEENIDIIKGIDEHSLYTLYVYWLKSYSLNNKIQINKKEFIDKFKNS